MKFEMDNIEQLEQMQEVQKAQQLETEPPKLEKVEIAEQSAQNEENPPKLERGTTLGESVEAFCKRKALESSTNRVQAEYRARDYAKQVEEDARKEKEYREKLYGK